MEKENATDILIKLFVKEYQHIKEERDDLVGINASLDNKIQMLYQTENDNAEERRRLRELLSPAITWFNGEPLYLSKVSADAMKEICKILKIEEHPKATL